MKKLILLSLLSFSGINAMYTPNDCPAAPASYLKAFAELNVELTQRSASELNKLEEIKAKLEKLNSLLQKIAHLEVKLKRSYDEVIEVYKAL